MTEERRRGHRYLASFPIRVEWEDENGEKKVSEGLTENVGLKGTLIHLPRILPNVGNEVSITVSEKPSKEVTVLAEVIRLERNAAHPQVALMLSEEDLKWEKEVWEYAAELLAAEKPDEFEDWN
jgi:PilZ domain